jgi:hypothetical protein
MADKLSKEDQQIKDIFDNRRFFVFDDNKKYYIDAADLESARQADWHYSKTYNEALLAGVTTAAQMQDILEERKITGDDWEKKRLELLDELEAATADLEAAETVADKKKCIAAVENVRNRIFRHNQRASGPLQNTCEQLADDARVEFLTSAMVKDEDGERVWNSYEAYKTDTNVRLVVRARFESMLALQGLQTDFLDQTPEARAKREIEALESETDKKDKTTPDEKSKKKK